MANIVPRPLNRFRKTDNHRMFHERWGDVAISAPTATYPHPPQRSLSRKHPNPQSSRSSSISTASTDGNDDDDRICLVSSSNSNSSSSSPSRQTPFSLNPRRLSMRLAPRAKLAPDDAKEKKDHSQSGAQKDTKKVEFAYKPIHQDYPTEVAEKVARQHPALPSPSSRFRYIPAAPQYSGDLETASWKRYSSISRVSMQGLPTRPGNRNSSLSEEAYEDNDNECYEATSPRSVGSYRGSMGYGQRAAAVSSKNASSSTDKKRARASRYMTMTMVPDPEDIYG